MAAHRLYLATRDKHIAHSVSPLEECQIGIALTNEDPTQVKTIMWTHLELGLQPGVFPSLGRLTELLHPVVAEKISRAAAAAEAEARALDADELSGRQQSGFALPEMDVAGSARVTPTPMPASGTKGYVAEAVIHPEPIQGPAFGRDRKRNMIVVRGPDEPMVWRSLEGVDEVDGG